MAAKRKETRLKRGTQELAQEWVDRWGRDIELDGLRTLLSHVIHYEEWTGRGGMRCGEEKNDQMERLKQARRAVNEPIE
jgi:hypothetical protein